MMVKLSHEDIAAYDAIFNPTPTNSVFIAPPRYGKTTTLHYLLYRWLIQDSTLIPYIWDWDFDVNADPEWKSNWCGVPMYRNSAVLAALKYPQPSVLARSNLNLDAWLEPVCQLIDARLVTRLEEDPLYHVATQTRRPVLVILDVPEPKLAQELINRPDALRKLQKILLYGRSQLVHIFFAVHSMPALNGWQVEMDSLKFFFCQNSRSPTPQILAADRHRAETLPPAPISSLQELVISKLATEWHQFALPGFELSPLLYPQDNQWIWGEAKTEAKLDVEDDSAKSNNIKSTERHSVELGQRYAYNDRDRLSRRGVYEVIDIRENGNCTLSKVLRNGKVSTSHKSWIVLSRHYLAWQPLVEK